MNYQCTFCGRKQVKLYRLASQFARSLLCFSCLKEQGLFLQRRPDGEIETPWGGISTPALPTPGGDFWGRFAECPEAQSARSWWDTLPE